MTHFFRHLDGVHVLLADRSEVGWKGVPERSSNINNDMPYGTEVTPEHVHHNWRHTDAYEVSKKNRNVQGASLSQFAKGLSNEKYW
jgi:hypothetical protein